MGVAIMSQSLLDIEGGQENWFWSSHSLKGHAVPNTGNVARDHLANERTFLAWFRTALSLVGAGFAIAKFVTTIPGSLAGMAFILLGAVTLFYSRWRYDNVREAIEQGQFRI